VPHPRGEGVISPRAAPCGSGGKHRIGAVRLIVQIQCHNNVVRLIVESFQKGDLPLYKLNFGVIILLPKKENAT
jgi:hypothetical protein